MSEQKEKLLPEKIYVEINDIPSEMQDFDGYIGNQSWSLMLPSYTRTDLYDTHTAQNKMLAEALLKTEKALRFIRHRDAQWNDDELITDALNCHDEITLAKEITARTLHGMIGEK